MNWSHFDDSFYSTLFSVTYKVFWLRFQIFNKNIQTVFINVYIIFKIIMRLLDIFTMVTIWSVALGWHVQDIGNVITKQATIYIECNEMVSKLWTN
jgi:hypothetical protein